MSNHCEENLRVCFNGTRKESLYKLSLLFMITVTANPALVNKIATLNNAVIITTILSIFQLLAAFLYGFVWFRFVFNNISLSNGMYFSLPKNDLSKYLGFILYTVFWTLLAAFMFGSLKSFLNDMGVNIWLNLFVSLIVYMICLNYLAYIITKRFVKEIYLGTENLYFNINYSQYLFNSIKSIFFALTFIGIPKSFEILFHDNFLKVIKSKNYKFVFKAKYTDLFSILFKYILISFTIIGYPFALYVLLKWFIEKINIEALNSSS